MTRPAHTPVDRRTLLAGLAGVLLALSGASRHLARSVLEGVAKAATDAEGEPVLITRDEPLPVGRTLAAGDRTMPPRQAPRFNLVGLHWRGDGGVWFRTRQVSGAWSSWQRSVVHELPDPGSAEDRRHEWRAGRPVWTGESSAIQYRLAGAVTRLRAHFVWSPPVSSRRLAAALTPLIITREEWGADEDIVRAGPTYADRLALVVVHHTAGESPASADDSIPLVRAIQAYHVKANGWNDIGYNFLVDPFGQVFEGRGGGIDRNVVGAHALGFNTGSVGVALIGNLEQVALAPEARSALAMLLSWRLDVAHVDPLSLVAYMTDGNLRTLRAISGHLDVNPTECPGHNLYPELDGIAADASALDLPKLYEPRAERLPAGAVRFSARVSEPRGWSVTVSGPDGAQAARGEGSGAILDWTWEPGEASPGLYAYSIDAGPGVRAAGGVVELGPSGPGPEAGEPSPAPPRPGSIPRRIPRWAREMRAWHSTPPAQRGPRPESAPTRLPHWYWEWLSWLRSVERWKKASPGGGAP